MEWCDPGIYKQLFFSLLSTIRSDQCRRGEIPRIPHSRQAKAQWLRRSLAAREIRFIIENVRIFQLKWYFPEFARFAIFRRTSQTESGEWRKQNTLNSLALFRAKKMSKRRKDANIDRFDFSGWRNTLTSTLIASNNKQPVVLRMLVLIIIALLRFTRLANIKNVRLECPMTA